MFFLRFLIQVLLFVTVVPAVAQDLSKIDKKNPVKVTGGIQATQTFYHANGIANRRAPYFWMLNANLNINVLGVLSIPLSAVVSQQQKSYTQPFNQYGVSPRYKAVTAHLGYRSMQFSEFTLAGNIFLGAGLEVAPSDSWIKASAMYGRFTKAISVTDTQGVITGQPALERLGYGGKITVGKKINRSADVIVFHGKDQYNSIPSTIADSFGLKPAENLVIGLQTRQSIKDNILFDIEYTLSAYTLDTRMDEESSGKYKVLNNTHSIFTNNASTQINKAILSNLTFNQRKYQFRITYRRIDPEFKTMGSVYLNNDLEDISGNISFRLLKNKLSTSIGSGIQRNNLDNALASKMNRYIGSVQLSFAANKQWNFNGMYSNFTANTKVNNSRVSPSQLSLTQNPDSLAYNQITNNATVGFNYNHGTDKVKHIVFGNLSFQKANDNKGNNSIFYNTNAGYQHSFIPQGLNLSVSLNYSTSIIKALHNQSIGPNFSVSKQLFQKALKTMISITYLKTLVNETSSGTTSMIRWANTYKKGKHHSITFDVTFMNRVVTQGKAPSFNEVRANLIYGYMF